MKKSECIRALEFFIFRFWFLSVIVLPVAAFAALITGEIGVFVRYCFFAYGLGTAGMAVLLLALIVPAVFRRALRSAVTLALISFLVCSLGACATTSTDNGGGASSVSSGAVSILGQVESYTQSIKWIIPLAGSVIAAFFPQYAAETQMAIASYNGLLATADELIAQARGGTADPTKLDGVLADLKAAWAKLDGSYKADVTAVEALAAG